MQKLGVAAYPKNIYELFAGKVFKVPDYQRNYSWTKKNWEDFWNDIKEGLLTYTYHYWGTITSRVTSEVVYCDERDIPFNLYEVIDGQQRITTLYLFLLALANVGKPALKDNFIKCGEKIYRLELGGLNNQFLKDLVDGKNPEPNIKTNKLLKECLEYFENQIRNSDLSINDLSKYLQNFTFSLEFTVQDQTLAVKAFETLNDRGKPLTLLDKMKSYLMFISQRYLQGKLNNLINEAFGRVFINYDIIKEIGEQENVSYVKSHRFTEDEILRFFYHYFSNFAIQKWELPTGYNFDATAEDIFESFLKTACNHLKNNSESLENFIREFTEGIDKFTFSFKELMELVRKDCKFKKLFSFLGLNTRIYPLIISLKLEDLLDNRMLELIETLDLRVYKIRGTDLRASLYRNVISQIKVNPNYEFIANGIRTFIVDFMQDTLFQYHLSRDMYNNSAIKFILWE